MTSSQDDTKVYEELYTFLQSDRSDLRISALDAVLSIRDAEDMGKLMRVDGIVSSLVKSCSHPDPVGVKAIQALSYLSSNSGSYENQCIEDLIDAGALPRLTELCLTPPSTTKDWKKRVNYSMGLLANMTRTERGSVDFVGRLLPDEAVKKSDVIEEKGPKVSMELLLSRFLSDRFISDEELLSEKDEEQQNNRDSQYDDPYQHFAAVLMNSTQTEVGKKFLLKLNYNNNKNDATAKKSSSSIFELILPQLRSKNPIRRRGIAGTIKNCCIDSNSAWWLLNEVNLMKHILYPLAGPEELTVDEKRGLDPDLWLDGPEKVRELDDFARLYLVDSILLLCASGRKSRETIRLARTYVILKLADMVEENEEVTDSINECVQYLRRDEEGTREGSSDDWMNKPDKKLITASGAVGKVDYDDVD
mmetsp:Transcript_25119/g.27678  ORF Transcript_25119/g.27678 Transcript_25119/m.27678 type:complete len:419 (-) Transcript_25119:30-1286(-)